MYTPPCTHRVHTARCSSMPVGDPRAVGLGGFQISLSQLEYRSVTARLDVPLGKTTCVWQAKSIKRSRFQFYSSSQKGHLPQSSSFSGPPYLGCVEVLRVLARTCFAAGTSFFGKCFFRQTAAFFHTELPFSYITYLKNTLKHALAVKCLFEPSSPWV